MNKNSDKWSSLSILSRESSNRFSLQYHIPKGKIFPTKGAIYVQHDTEKSDFKAKIALKKIKVIPSITPLQYSFRFPRRYAKK